MAPGIATPFVRCSGPQQSLEWSPRKSKHDIARKDPLTPLSTSRAIISVPYTHEQTHTHTNNFTMQYLGQYPVEGSMDDMVGRQR
mmetsp:Transcript_88826/g.173804  ORF Transcript_88826/g.173804 Transcript_88826/m.173804 type:complete len:85 (+) Transcript_88826:279-533(+)